MSYTIGVQQEQCDLTERILYYTLKIRFYEVYIGNFVKAPTFLHGYYFHILIAFRVPPALHLLAPSM